MACRSQPASGSVAPKMESGRPCARPGRCRSCWLSDPNAASAETAPIAEWTERRPAAVGTSVATRVMTRASSCMVQPVPPNRSGTSSPHSPASPRAVSAACENVPTGAAGASSRGAGDQADAASGFMASYSRDWPRSSAMARPARSTTSATAARSCSAASAAASAKPDGVMASARDTPHRLAAAQLLRVVMFRPPVIMSALIR